METQIVLVTLRNGHRFAVDAKLIKQYLKGKLFFYQERLIITDLSNNEIMSNDIIDLVEQII